MAFYVQSDRLLEVFPEQCPYCANRKATSSFVQPFGKMESKHSSETLLVKLAACHQCARWFKRSRLMMFIIGFSVPVALLGSVFIALSYPPQREPKSVEVGTAILWLMLFVAWVFLIIWRRWRFRLFRVAYFNDNEVTYAGRDGAHMKRFAELNELKAEEKSLLLRLR